MGADEVIDYNSQPVDQLFKGNPFDAVLDVVGGEFADPHGHQCMHLLHMRKVAFSQYLLLMCRTYLSILCCAHLHAHFLHAWQDMIALRFSALTY